MLIVQQETTAKNKNRFLLVFHLVQTLENDRASVRWGDGGVLVSCCCEVGLASFLSGF